MKNFFDLGFKVELDKAAQMGMLQPLGKYLGVIHKGLKVKKPYHMIATKLQTMGVPTQAAYSHVGRAAGGWKGFK